MYEVQAYEGNGIWTPVENGRFDTEEEALAAIDELQMLSYWQAVMLKILFMAIMGDVFKLNISGE